MFLIVLSKYNNVIMVYNSYSNITFLIIGALSGIYLMIYCAKILEIYYCKQWFIVVGQNTLSILYLHFTAYLLVNCIQVILRQAPTNDISAFPTIYCENILWIPVYLIFGGIIPIAVQQFIITNINKSISYSKNVKQV